MPASMTEEARMLVCTKEHESPGFGTIPVGSLWADDSPHVTDSGCFATVSDEPAVKPKKGAR